MSKTAHAGFVALVLLTAVVPLHAQDTAAGWLERMTARTDAGNYKVRGRPAHHLLAAHHRRINLEPEVLSVGDAVTPSVGIPCRRPSLISCERFFSVSCS